MEPPLPTSELMMRLTATSAALREGASCVLHQDFDHRFDFVDNLPPSWPHTALLGKREKDVFPSATAAKLAAAHDRSIGAQSLQSVQFQWGRPNEPRYFEARFIPDASGVAIAILDHTESRAHDEAMTSLLREVSHRSKNLLAIVQSVAMQTARHSGDIGDFLSKFRGRLHALSGTQDLVTDSNWRGTYLHALVGAQLARLISPELSNVHISGPNSLLGPNASLHVGLAIHELAANSVRYGALAPGGIGRIRVFSELRHETEQDTSLVIEWQEAGLDDSRIINSPRFGSQVLQQVVPLSVGGHADLTIEPQGVKYRLTIPSGQFEA